MECPLSVTSATCSKEMDSLRNEEGKLRKDPPHPHTHTFILTHTHTLSPSLPPSLPPSLSLSLTHTHTKWDFVDPEFLDSPVNLGWSEFAMHFTDLGSFQLPQGFEEISQVTTHPIKVLEERGREGGRKGGREREGEGGRRRERGSSIS